MPGKGTREILLSLTPIVTIDSLYLDDGLVPDTSYRVVDADMGSVQSDLGFRGSYYANKDSWGDFPSTEAKEVFFFTYDGGYVLPGWGTSHGDRTLPFDLERAIIDTVRMQYKSKGTGSGGGIVWDGVMKSYKIGDTAITWGDGSGGSGSGGNSGDVSAYFPPSALAVLNWYRRAF